MVIFLIEKYLPKERKSWVFPVQLAHCLSLTRKQSLIINKRAHSHLRTQWFSTLLCVQLQQHKCKPATLRLKTNSDLLMLKCFCNKGVWKVLPKSPTSFTAFSTVYSLFISSITNHLLFFHICKYSSYGPGKPCGHKHTARLVVSLSLLVAFLMLVVVWNTMGVRAASRDILRKWEWNQLPT